MYLSEEEKLQKPQLTVLVAFFKALTGSNTDFFNCLRDIYSGISTQVLGSLPLITKRE